jgi:hypothetical protein
MVEASLNANVGQTAQQMTIVEVLNVQLADRSVDKLVRETERKDGAIAVPAITKLAELLLPVSFKLAMAKAFVPEIDPKKVPRVIADISAKTSSPPLPKIEHTQVFLGELRQIEASAPFRWAAMDVKVYYSRAYDSKLYPTFGELLRDNVFD